MQSVVLDLIGAACGIAVYAAGRAVFGHRAARRGGTQRARVDGLLAPYEQLTMVPLRVRDELPANVHRLYPRD